MTATAQLYDASNLSSLVWPDTDDGRYARTYLTPIISQGATRYVGNVKTETMVVVAGDVVLPVTVNDAEYDNSYVCSPFTHYISYAREELRTLKNPRLERALAVMIDTLGGLLKAARINRTVMVNNWFLSTNLYAGGVAPAVDAITDQLRARYPDHAICFRSVDDHSNPDLVWALRRNRYQLLAGRQVYIVERGDPRVKQNRSWKRDLKLYKEVAADVVDHDQITPADYPRIVELYNALYLDKYSTHNPNFTEAWVAHTHQSRTLHLMGVRQDGRLNGILGYFLRNGFMTTPLFGYDTSLPVKAGLYRILMTAQQFEAEKRGVVLHQSAGAAEFKRSRGAWPHLEYNAVLYDHLSPLRRAPWAGLQQLLERVFVTLLEKYEL